MCIWTKDLKISFKSAKGALLRFCSEFIFLFHFFLSYFNNVVLMINQILSISKKLEKRYNVYISLLHICKQFRSCNVLFTLFEYWLFYLLNCFDQTKQILEFYTLILSLSIDFLTFRMKKPHILLYINDISFDLKIIFASLLMIYLSMLL